MRAGWEDDTVVPVVVEEHLSAWRDQFRVPAVLTSPEFLILWRNEAAAQLLDGNDPHGRVGEPLSWASKGRLAQLRVITEEIADQPRLWVYDPPGRPRLLVRIQQVAGRRGDRTFGFLFYGGETPVAPVWADLGCVFGLTPTESVVVRGLVSGRGAEQLAGDLRVGLETIRTHIRRAYHKLEHFPISLHHIRRRRSSWRIRGVSRFG